MSLTLLGLSDGRLASSFDDNTIKITNDLKFNSYSTLTGHSERINSLAELNGQVLASGSCDNTIRIWNLTTMTNITTLTSHTGCIRALLSIKIDETNLLISAADDKSVKIWNNSHLINSF